MVSIQPRARELGSDVKQSTLGESDLARFDSLYTNDGISVLDWHCDYLFVKGLARFVALTVAKAPRATQKTLIGGLAALDAELDWFESHARERDLDLTVASHPACRRYVDFLMAVAYSQPVEVLLAVFYGVEVAYTVAWGKLKPEGPYAEFIDRWTQLDFQAYVNELNHLVDAHPHPRQQEYFNEVMRFERDFWHMTWEG